MNAGVTVTFVVCIVSYAGTVAVAFFAHLRKSN